ncbi:MAG: hypothetical protein SGILL_004039 [Bacillariaceae sp.]
MEDFPWNMHCTAVAVASDHTSRSSSSDGDDLMQRVFDDISVLSDDFADLDRRTGSNQSPVCVSGVYDDLTEYGYENNLVEVWGGKYVHDVGDVEIDDDAETLPVGDEFVNSDAFEDAIKKLCFPILEQQQTIQPRVLAPAVPVTKGKKTTKTVKKAKRTMTTTTTTAYRSIAPRPVVDDNMVSPSTLDLPKVLVFDPQVTPGIPEEKAVGFSCKIGAPFDPRVPNARRCFVMTAFHSPGSNPRAARVPDVEAAPGIEAPSNAAGILPFQPEANVPAVITVPKAKTSKVDDKQKAGHVTTVKAAKKRVTFTKSSAKKTPVKKAKAVKAPRNQRKKAPPNVRLEQEWQKYFEQVKEYSDKHGNCVIPSKYDTNPKLAQWAKRQRYQYKLYQDVLEGNVDETVVHSSLTLERKKLLDSVGFCWNLHDASWEETFRLFQEYDTKFGKGNVPAHVKPLHRWCNTQRRLLKDGSLPLERFVKLEKAGFQWTAQAQPTNDPGNMYSDYRARMTAEEDPKGVVSKTSIENLVKDEMRDVKDSI